MNRLFLIPTFLSCFFLSCKKDPAFIDPELAIYIDRFLDEAAKRDIEVEADNLQAFILAEVTEGEIRLCGKGYSPMFGDKFRQIDISQFCWEFATDIEKEILIFHELGHALLDREHQSSKMNNGRNRSIMFSGPTCDIYTSYTECHSTIRQYYINELFNTRTSNPFWSVRQNLRRIVIKDSFDASTLAWDILSTDSSTDPIHLSVSQDSTQFHSAPASLLLEQTTATSPNTAPFIQGFADVGFLKPCSNINIEGRIKTENLGNGWLDIQIQYPSFDEFGNPFSDCVHQFTIRETATSQTTFQTFSFDEFCVPGGKKDFEIRLALRTPTPAKVYIDDLKLTLWD